MFESLRIWDEVWQSRYGATVHSLQPPPRPRYDRPEQLRHRCRTLQDTPTEHADTQCDLQQLLAFSPAHSIRRLAQRQLSTALQQATPCPTTSTRRQASPSASASKKPFLVQKSTALLMASQVRRADVFAHATVPRQLRQQAESARPFGTACCCSFCMRQLKKQTLSRLLN